jgi:ATP-dependent protease ClpP protease subunit
MLKRIRNNLKTSVAGVAASIASVVAVFGYEVDPKMISAILSGVVLVLGLFSKD